MKKDTARLLMFTNGGHRIELESAMENVSHSYQSGYASPDNFCQPYHWHADPKDKLTRHWDNIDIPKNGIPVIDKRDMVKSPEGIDWIFKSPMLDIRLKKGQISPPFANVYEGDPSLATGLSYISLEDYIELWKKHGAKIGKFTLDNLGNGKITWE